jgi:chromate transporter
MRVVTVRGSVGEVFAAFLKLGLTSFGGPVAHLGYFRSEFVERRLWLDEAAYADLVALCAVVALAVLGMARSLAPDRARATLAVTAAVFVLAVPSAWAQIGAIILGGVAGFILYRADVVAAAAPLNLAASPAGSR